MDNINLNIANTGTLAQFLHKYSSWAKYQNFNGDNVEELITNSETGLPCFLWTMKYDIENCAEPIVVIDALSRGSDILPLNKGINPDRHYIVFSNGQWNPAEYDASLYTLFTFSNELYEYADMWLNSNRPIGFNQNKIYDFSYPKPHQFVCFTSTDRTDRIHFILHVHQNLTFLNYIMRFKGVDYGMPSSHDDVVQTSTKNFQQYTQLVLSSGLPVGWNTLGHTIPMKIYNQCYYALVVESTIDNQDFDIFNLTEKTIKPLLTGMPFVMMSSVGHLRKLRAMGFTTYDKFWDESYDEEPDFEKRVSKVIDLCNSLVDFDWVGHQKQLEQVRYQNLDRIINLNQLMDQEFRAINKKIKELTLP